MKKRMTSRNKVSRSQDRFFIKEGKWHHTNNGSVFAQCGLVGSILYYRTKHGCFKLTCYYDPILAKETCKWLNETKPTVYVPWMLPKKIKMKYIWFILSNYSLKTTNIFTARLYLTLSSGFMNTMAKTVVNCGTPSAK